MSVRILDPAVPLTDIRAARMAAEAIVLYGLNYERAARDLRPDLTTRGQQNYFALKLRKSRHVKRALEKLMSTPERNATKFLDIMWNWLEAPPSESPLDKTAHEQRLTAARVLARGYINEKAADKPTGAPMVLDIGNEGVAALTGEKVTPIDSKRVM